MVSLPSKLQAIVNQRHVTRGQYYSTTNPCGRGSRGKGVTETEHDTGAMQRCRRCVSQFTHEPYGTSFMAIV